MERLFETLREQIHTSELASFAHPIRPGHITAKQKALAGQEERMGPKTTF